MPMPSADWLTSCDERAARGSSSYQHWPKSPMRSLSSARRRAVASRSHSRRLSARSRTRHLALVEQLIPAAEQATMVTAVDHACAELQRLVSAVGVVQELSARSADAIHAFGEELSSRLVAASLHACRHTREAGSIPRRCSSPTSRTAEPNLSSIRRRGS